jgi:hypothetical protein
VQLGEDLDAGQHRGLGALGLLEGMTSVDEVMHATSG